MARINQPRIRFDPRESLSEVDRDDLFEFLDRFSSRSRERFDAQLEREQQVFRVHGSRTGHLVGFGTLSILDVSWRGEPATLLSTGWAMLSPLFRGDAIIQRVGAKAWLEVRARRPTRRTYWLYTASTLNSYLLMANNFSEFWPRREAPWPERERAYLEQGLAQLGARWDHETGVIARAGSSSYREGRVTSADIDSADPHAAFYARANPGQAAGDTLPCLAPLTVRSVVGFGLRAATRGLRRSSRRREGGA